jgi:hypothetical protein
MVLRAAAGGSPAAAASPAAESVPAAAASAANAVDTAEVAERVFRMMQRDLRLDRERGRGAGGRRWRSSL